MKITRIIYSAIAVFLVILFFVLACGPDKFIASEEKNIEMSTTKYSQGEELIYTISCYPNSGICRNGNYYLCVKVSGNCSCADEEVTKTDPYCDGAFCKDSNIVRVCHVENVTYYPADIEKIIHSFVPEHIVKTALKCYPHWNSNLGYKSGYFWTYIKDKDHMCKTTKPSP